MLSWTFALAALALAAIDVLVPSAVRRHALAVASILGVAVVWRIPLVTIVTATLAVWGAGRVLPRLAPATRRPVLGVGIAVLMATLAFAKRAGASESTLGTTTAVIGLSYFTLKFIQHLVDAAAGRADGVDLSAFATSIFFLPTYSAGPIERTTEFARTFATSTAPWPARVVGLERIVLGLGKKLLLADPLLTWAEPAFRSPGLASRGDLALAVYAFALGLYLDFSAYSDLAIGTARAVGITVRENFDWPYLRPNLGALWQHWHMSFTGWLRDFVFTPVARRTLRRTGRPLLSQMAAQTVTMLACGLWHGIAWHFAAWGAYHAAGLGVLAFWRSRRRADAAEAAVPRVLATVATFHFFALGLILFACDLRRAGLFLGRLAGLR